MEWPDLHISGPVPDWERVPRSEWNDYQRRAAATHGIDTPGNRTTLKGLVCSAAGNELIRRGRMILGMAALGVGRGYDMKDGKIADETGTKGPIGEAFDAWTDNALLLHSAAVLHARDIVSDREITAFKTIVASKFVVTGLGKALDKQIKPNRLSKYFTFTMWTGIGSKVLGAAIEETADLLEGANVLSVTKSDVAHTAARGFTRFGGSLIAIGTAGNIAATATYVQKLMAPNDQQVQHEAHAVGVL